MRKCKHCGKNLDGTHLNRKFCSAACLNKARYIRYGQRSTPEQRSEWYKKRCRVRGYKNRLREQGRVRYHRVQGFLREYKLDHGCAKCGYKEHHAALEFDHIRGEKKLNICFAKSIKQARDEIEKCQVLCANCHGIVTYERIVED